MTKVTNGEASCLWEVSILSLRWIGAQVLKQLGDMLRKTTLLRHLPWNGRILCNPYTRTEPNSLCDDVRCQDLLGLPFVRALQGHATKSLACVRFGQVCLGACPSNGDVQVTPRPVESKARSCAILAPHQHDPSDHARRYRTSECHLVQFGVII